MAPILIFVVVTVVFQFTLTAAHKEKRYIIDKEQ